MSIFKKPKIKQQARSQEIIHTKIQESVKPTEREAENKNIDPDVYQAIRDELMNLIDLRIDSLRQKRDVVEQPYTLDQIHMQRRASLLPDEGMLHRLIRYETHASRSMHRAIETLAKALGIFGQPWRTPP